MFFHTNKGLAHSPNSRVLLIECFIIRETILPKNFNLNDKFNIADIEDLYKKKITDRDYLWYEKFDKKILNGIDFLYEEDFRTLFTTHYIYNNTFFNKTEKIFKKFYENPYRSIKYPEYFHEVMSSLFEEYLETKNFKIFFQIYSLRFYNNCKSVERDIFAHKDLLQSYDSLIQLFDNKDNSDFYIQKLKKYKDIDFQSIYDSVMDTKGINERIKSLKIDLKFIDLVESSIKNKLININDTNQKTNNSIFSLLRAAPEELYKLETSLEDFTVTDEEINLVTGKLTNSEKYNSYTYMWPSLSEDLKKIIPNFETTGQIAIGQALVLIKALKLEEKDLGSLKEEFTSNSVALQKKLRQLYIITLLNDKNCKSVQLKKALSDCYDHAIYFFKDENNQVHDSSYSGKLSRLPTVDTSIDYLIKDDYLSRTAEEINTTINDLQKLKEKLTNKKN